MRYRQFGKTGATVSEVGLGTWQIGGTEWGDVTDADALAILHRSADAGVTLFDTADIYGGGRSEQLIGRFLRERKASESRAGGQPITVVTKLGRRFDPPNGWPQNFTLDVIRRHTQDSIKRLGVESLFLTQWHCIPPEQLRSGEVFAHLETIRAEGLIRHWGVSVESVEEGLTAMAHPGCASLQVIYNIFRQKLTDELLPHAAAKGVAILARVPLASGLLSGRFTADTKFGARDHRHFNADGQAFNVGETFAGLPFAEGVALAGKVREILAPKGDVTMAQLALRWVLDNPHVSAVIPGATKLSQAESNARASDLPPLPPEAHGRLKALYEAEVKAKIRGPY
jgi:aryl-alcohol dehydrogenase-like predicted oxidoreductase